MAVSLEQARVDRIRKRFDRHRADKRADGRTPIVLDIVDGHGEYDAVAERPGVGSGPRHAVFASERTLHVASVRVILLRERAELAVVAEAPAVGGHDSHAHERTGIDHFAKLFQQHVGIVDVVCHDERRRAVQYAELIFDDGVDVCAFDRSYLFHEEAEGGFEFVRDDIQASDENDCDDHEADREGGDRCSRALARHRRVGCIPCGHDLRNLRMGIRVA